MPVSVAVVSFVFFFGLALFLFFFLDFGEDFGFELERRQVFGAYGGQLRLRFAKGF